MKEPTPEKFFIPHGLDDATGNEINLHAGSKVVKDKVCNIYERVTWNEACQKCIDSVSEIIKCHDVLILSDDEPLMRPRTFEYVFDV